MNDGPGILLTSAASVVLLVQCFREAVEPLGGRVIAGDMRPDGGAAAYFAHHFEVLPPTENEEAFRSEIVEICRKYSVKLIVPTRDGDLPFLARQKKSLERETGARIVVSPERSISICLDKRAFVEFCKGHDIPVPRLYTPAEARKALPVFARPRFGAASVGCRKVTRQEELSDLTEDAYVLNEYISAPEYTVDLLRDLEGRKTLGLAVRRRVRVRNGEAWESLVVDHPAMEEMAKRLASLLQLAGHVNMQFFDHPQKGPLAIEVNPRFGGGSNLSIHAGLASPELLLRMAIEPEEPLPKIFVQTGFRSMRYVQDIVLDGEGNPIRVPQGGKV